jgi:NADH-quinone oxidoreductase subunit G
MGVQASCSVTPSPGLVVRTNTKTVREIRKIAVELLLANHDMNCPTCPKSRDCKLQDIARRLGIDKVRYKPLHAPKPIDDSSHALLRDPNKCVLCGDCVRACHELEGVGAIDFAYRGASSAVLPAFGKDLDAVECVSCGQCATVCPTGALSVRSEIDTVWAALDDPAKTVVVQMAPAVRVGLAEYFGIDAGSAVTGKAVAALKTFGFDQVYDTSFTADMTVLEEAEEFLGRFARKERLPQFTSCCPAWVTFAEQYFPELLDNLSSCRSPQQMFGSLARRVLPAMLDIAEEDLVIVSLMPCSAKKAEAKQDKLQSGGRPDVDHVITTAELGRMIEQAGIDFATLEPGSFDMPFGYKTGAGVIFGASGGVTEAVLRYAVEKVSGAPLAEVDFHAVRGEDGLREAEVKVGDVTLKLAVVHGLANARRVAERVAAGEADYHLIEVMACPGGCIAGAGQPVAKRPEARRARAKALYDEDKLTPFHTAQDNAELARIYAVHLGDVGGHAAHALLHTDYQHRQRMTSGGLAVLGSAPEEALKVSVCVGTTCFLNGSQEILRGLMNFVRDEGLTGRVDLRATFCFERCMGAPNVQVGDEVLGKCTLDQAKAAILAQIGAVHT